MKERGNQKLKLLDKYLGIPLIFTLGLFRKKNVKMKNPKNIIIVMIAAIGDTILLSAIIKELKWIFPNVKITLVCSNENYQAAKNISSVNNIVKFDMGNILKSFLNLRKMENHDLLFDFGAWSRLNAIISYVIKAYTKVGFKRKNMFRHYIYDLTAEHIDYVHEIDNYRSLLQSLHLDLLNLNPEFIISEESKSKITTILNKKQKYIVFHLFASGSHKEKKEWLESSWIELANRLIDEGYFIILTGGKQDSSFASKLAEEIDQRACLSFAGKLSLEETAALIEKVGIIVTVNTGIMHLAAAVNAKIIALHGPTSFIRWGPISAKSIILTPTIKCDRLLSLGFEKHNCVIENGCISTIEVNVVYDAIANINQTIGGNFGETSSIL